MFVSRNTKIIIVIEQRIYIVFWMHVFFSLYSEILLSKQLNMNLEIYRQSN